MKSGSMMAWVLGIGMAISLPAGAAAPRLYVEPAYQSVVRGEPDDLLLLAGDGFAADDVVVYEAAVGTAEPLSPPLQVPERPTADLGLATVVTTSHVPYSLTIRLPAILHVRTEYRLWVRTHRGEWSQPAHINDLRPLWISPAILPERGSQAGLPRVLKLIGLNVDPSPGRRSSVRLSGPTVRIFSAESAEGAAAPYVARIPLPASLEPGSYRVEASRDGVKWVSLPDQSLKVRATTPPEPVFDVSDSRFGRCLPNRQTDVTACVVRAVEAARAAGSGTVLFPPGVWHLESDRTPGVTAGDGIVLPAGVNLRGAGALRTRVERSSRWTGGTSNAAFTLTGHNLVEGFTFADERVHSPKDIVNAFLHVGVRPGTHETVGPVSDLVVTHNRFDRTDEAISASGTAMNRIFITYNVFGTYGNALELSGDLFDMSTVFHLDDSVIAHNRFEPGSLLDVAAARGPIASEIGASDRVDFSDNVADGASTEFLDAPDDARGWRAGFFWHMNDNQEKLLIADNVVTCAADKVGDGEAIGLDNSGNAFAFESMRTVRAADLHSVTVDGPLAARQYDRDIPLNRYYVGEWMQVGDGPGMGQARKIRSYATHADTGRVTFVVMPGWDVVPAAGASRISVGREFWQTLILNNRVDHRKPPCQKSNRSRNVGGAMALWAQLADSVVAGNRMYDTDGIVFHENAQAPRRMCTGCGAEAFFQSFLDIRDNEISGRYDPGSDCGPSGIRGGLSAAPEGPDAPPTLGYGVAISHNLLVDVDNNVGGAIAVSQDWYAGPAPQSWPLLDGLIIAHNRIEGGAGTVTGKGCDTKQPTRGISFPGAPLVWNAVLSGNTCVGVSLPLGPGGRSITRDCATSATDSCECAPARGRP